MATFKLAHFPRHGISRAARWRFTAAIPWLAREINGRPAVFLDGPAGTQVPQRVMEAITQYLTHCNANHGGEFLTSRESDAMLDETHRAVADLLGADDPACVSFGPNMTTLTFAISRALARMWQPGNEVVVTRLDHDANVTPWVLAVRDAGATVRYVDFHREDCTLDMESFRAQLNHRTRMVAVGCASNSTGSINPVREICAAARAVGALTFLDAVHFAPHALIDVNDFGCDFLACSAYKFFGPHIGVMWGRRDLLESLVAYKVRPASNELPDKWMTGTQNHECLAGTLEAVNYLADLGRLVTQQTDLNRRQALQSAYAAIRQYETQLMGRLLAGLREIPDVTIYGVTDPARLSDRMPTVSITHRRLPAIEVARRLGDAGIFVWHGNYYALQITEVMGLEPQGIVRLGLVHYNTAAEVDRCLESLRGL